MTNIFQLKQSLEQLQNNPRFTEPQRQFFKTLLEGQPGESGWRSFAEIAKSPIIENKVGRLSAAIQLEYEKTPSWDLISRYKLRKLRQKITDDRTDEEKIDWIRRKNPPFDLIKKELAIKFSINANVKNDIDHLIDTLKKKISQTSWSDLTYLRALRRLQAQLTAFKTNQIQRWVVIQQNKRRVKKDDLLCEETVTRFHGTILLPMKQRFDYRLGSSQGECRGYVKIWGSALLTNTPFFGVTSNQTPLFKHVKYASATGQRYPELNHGAILTEEISNVQYDIYEPLGISSTLISMQTFFHSIDKLAEKLVTTVDNHPTDVLLLGLMHYSAGHFVGLCKKDDNYHFFDSNLGWVRFNQAHDFQTWFPFYFKTIGYSSKTVEYKDMFHESMMVLMKYDPTITQQAEAHPPSSSPLVCFSRMACLMLTFSPCVAGLVVYYVGIRGLIYEGLYLSAKIKNACQATESFEIPLTECARDQYSADDIELLFYNQRTNHVTPSISHHCLAGTLFKAERDRSRYVSDDNAPVIMKLA